jgi:adenylate cyclase
MDESRKIAAILVADVVGFSRLTGADEDRTLARLRALRSDLIDPTIAVHKGRVVKRTGDGAIVEFRSVVDAVRCAIEIQNSMVERNTGLPPERRIEFRVGIHLGDVVEESDGDLMGDGVNIAARLEGVAQPGAICLSEDAYRQVKSRLDLAISDLGETKLKNIAEPIRVYSLQIGNAIAVKATSLAGAATPVAPALPLPEKPSVAVLPFQNMSGDPEQEYFADGMVEEIVTSLSRIRWLFVIARNSSFTYKGRTVDVKQIGRELGVRYVLEGSVRKGGGRVRITAQLIDAGTGAHLWADRIEGSLEDVFDLQDRVASSVAGVIEPALRQAEIVRAQRKRPESLDAYDLYLRAFPIAFATTPQIVDKALDLLERAIAIASDYAAAHALIAWCLHTRFCFGGGADDVRLAALRHARIAIAAGGDDATALAIAAFVIGILEHDYDTAFNGFAQSLALSPSSALALGLSSLIRVWSGDDATAVEHANQAIRLSPFDPMIFCPYIALAYAHFFTGRFEEAAAAAGGAAQANPGFSIPAVLRTVALVRLGRKDDAATSVRRLQELVPDFTVSRSVPQIFRSPERFAKLAEALREAGLPE